MTVEKTRKLDTFAKLFPAMTSGTRTWQDYRTTYWS